MIVSDAGKPFAIDERPTVSGAAILVEAIDILMEQVRGLQFKRLELNTGTDGAAKPVWFSIDSELGEARREDISVLPFYRISLRRQLNVGLTITLPPGNPGDVSSTLGGIVTQMLDTDDLALWYALNRLMTNYWADVGSTMRRSSPER